MDDPKKYYTHTIQLGKERPGQEKKLIDFLKAGRPILIDLKSGKIIETKSIENGAEETE